VTVLFPDTSPFFATWSKTRIKALWFLHLALLVLLVITEAPYYLHYFVFHGPAGHFFGPADAVLLWLALCMPVTILTWRWYIVPKKSSVA
jgi:hypothetical protein